MCVPVLDEPPGPGHDGNGCPPAGAHYDVALRKAAVLMIKTRDGAAWGGAVVVAR